jgi:hypothetical protein
VSELRGLNENLHFYSLSLIGKVKVECVAALSQHMDFDERNQTLKLFGFPSFCCYICSVGQTAFDQ